MLVLGIDPGSIKSGYAILKVSGRKILHVSSGTLSFNSKTPFLDRLFEIKNQTAELVKEFKPNELALESLIYVKDPRALMKLAQTRGVIISEALDYCHEAVFEYSPNLIKSTVTGHGHANKESVQKAIQMVLKIDQFESFDHSDAIAVALCHALNRQGNQAVVGSSARPSPKGRGLKAALAHKI